MKVISVNEMCFQSPVLAGLGDGGGGLAKKIAPFGIEGGGGLKKSPTTLGGGGGGLYRW